MKSGNTRREMGFVVVFALAGLLMAMLVAFAPWYGPVAVAAGR